MDDPIFQVGFTTYLGKAYPIITPLVGRYFGKNATCLYKFGADLASASLPGQGHCVLHNILQSIVQSMMKISGIRSEKKGSQLHP